MFYHVFQVIIGKGDYDVWIEIVHMLSLLFFMLHREAYTHMLEIQK